ncbi:hypothetical protein TWF481_007871 [Arthrobotrys musiformis]|uniref:Uncharacterized protein n=1 Tax=Arthrobotrys musiformis TaxID=47236 RepID=A0AAV9WB88_9PEZI
MILRRLPRPSVYLRHITHANTAVSNIRPHGPPRRLCVSYSTTPSTGRRPVDVKVEDLSELYASARDEFEIALEETAKNTIYARDDRQTAREEFEKFKLAYSDALSLSSDDEAKEIKTRVGQRLREMESAIERLREADEEH